MAESKDLISCSLRDSRTSHHGYHLVSCSCLWDSCASRHLSYWTLSSSCVLSLSLSLSLFCPNCEYPTPSLLSSQIFSDGFVSGWFCVAVFF